MSEPVEFLGLEDVIGPVGALLADPASFRDVGLLGLAVAGPRTTVFGEDAYPDIWTKATAVLHSIVKNHAQIAGHQAPRIVDDRRPTDRRPTDRRHTVDTIAERLRQLAV